jgi:glycosyltransferase involved in cell wall biosynthesis
MSTISVAATAVSVVTVTYNNAPGLRASLSSLARLKVAPAEIVVVDGLSGDDTRSVVQAYCDRLPIRIVSERDDGIYDAMNKGQRLVRGPLVHYLNAGDEVWGEPYAGITGPCLLSTRICDADGQAVFDDFIKLRGYGYCHQGLVLPKDHEPYNLSLSIAADLEMIIGTFPRGLMSLPRASGGGVQFFLGGVSSTRRRTRDREICGVLFRRLPAHEAAWIAAGVLMKGFIPGGLRMKLAQRLSRGGAGQKATM